MKAAYGDYSYCYEVVVEMCRKFCKGRELTKDLVCLWPADENMNHL